MGRFVKTHRFGIPVFRVLGEYLFIALNIGSHRICAVVPHILIVHRIDTVYAQFIHQTLCQRIQTVRGCQCIKIWLFRNTVVDKVMFVENLYSDHLTEFGAFACCKSISFFFRKGLSVLVIFPCTLDHLHRHRSIDCFVLVEVEDPLQAGGKVVCYAISLFIGIDIHPLDPITQMEFPGQTAILGSPFVCNARNDLSPTVGAQQAIPQIIQYYTIVSVLSMQKVKGCQF